MARASLNRRVAHAARGAWHRSAARVTGRGRSACEHVDEWSRAHEGPDPVVLFPARTITRRPPRTVEHEIDPVYTSRLVAEQRARYLVPVTGARLVGTSGLVVLPDGSPAAESVYGLTDLMQDPAMVAPSRRRAVRRTGDHFSLLVHWSARGNYYHWFHDTLTRLHGVMDVLPADTTFVLPSGMRTFQDESLRAVGLDPRRVVHFDGDEDWEVETLHFAPPVTNSGSDRGATDLWVRDRILSHYGLVASPRGRRVFLSRQHAPSRRVVNHDEVEQALAEYGFESYVAEHLTLREQVELFTGAEVLVSAHGAGLTNMLFAAAGLAVVDMIDPSTMDQGYIFWAMAEELGHDYSYLLTEPVPRPGYQSDAVVPVDKLLATLGHLGLRAGG